MRHAFLLAVLVLTAVSVRPELARSAQGPAQPQAGPQYGWNRATASATILFERFSRRTTSAIRAPI